jgi:transcriptional regulator with XRE-family HTH domain
MQIHEKLRVMRQCKNWTQEELAEKLGWSVKGYAKIERGEVGVKLDKLAKVAEVFGVDIQEFVDTKEKTVFNFAENCTQQGNNIHCIVLSETQCAHELEKAQLLLQERNREIENLKQQIAQLQEINTLLRSKSE